MSKFISAAGIAFAAAAMTLPATPAAAADMVIAAPAATAIHTAPALERGTPGVEVAEHGRHRKWKRGHRHGHDDRYDDRGYRGQRYYDEPVYRDTRVWRGNDGRVYCRKSDGTTGLIVGAAAGALLGREIDQSGDRTLGTILGAAAGALIGKSLDDGVRCR